MSRPEIEVVWEEELWYREGEEAFCFQCSWSISPYVAHIPSARIWDSVTPPFLHGRRDEVLSALRDANDRHGHVLEDTEVGYLPWGRTRPDRRRNRDDRGGGRRRGGFDDGGSGR